MTHSDDLGALAAALARFQANMRPVPRNATGTDGTRYADIAAIRKHVMKRLNTCDLAVVQFAGFDKVETVILHKSGQWLAHETNITTLNGDSAYGPRYALMFALGLVQEPEAPAVSLPIVPHNLPSSEALLAIEVMQRLRLNEGQQRVLLMKHRTLEGLTAEAEKMAGGK